MASSTSLLFTIFTISLILISHTTSKTPKTLVLPITKATSSSSQYTTTINLQTHPVPFKLTVDLGGHNSWLICGGPHFNSSSYRHVTCKTPTCNLVSGTCQNCHAPPSPGCHPNTCATNAANRMTNHHHLGELGNYVANLQSQNGVVSIPDVVFACGVNSILEGLANGVVGMIGLSTSKSPISFPNLISNSIYKIPKKFAVCLSPNSKGVVIFGDKPYPFRPHSDVSVFLLYTPLIVNPPSHDYFINLTSIRMNGVDLPLNKTLLTINNNGHGGTKFSTITPYTVLESSIYNVVKNAFVKELSPIPRVKGVGLFEICYASKSLPMTPVGPSAPFVDFVMHHKDVFWRIYGANSLVSVDNGEVLCLGFVDGGVNVETSVVIGGHQMENSLLLFDVENTRLGFSYTLLNQQSSCGNYSFTSKHSQT